MGFFRIPDTRIRNSGSVREDTGRFPSRRFHVRFRRRFCIRRRLRFPRASRTDRICPSRPIAVRTRRKPRLRLRRIFSNSFFVFSAYWHKPNPNNATMPGLTYFAVAACISTPIRSPTPGLLMTLSNPAVINRPTTIPPKAAATFGVVFFMLSKFNMPFFIICLF